MSACPGSASFSAFSTADRPSGTRSKPSPIDRTPLSLSLSLLKFNSGPHFRKKSTRNTRVRNNLFLPLPRLFLSSNHLPTSSKETKIVEKVGWGRSLSDFFSRERGCSPSLPLFLLSLFLILPRSKSRGRPTNGARRGQEKGWVEVSRGKGLREIDERVVKLAPVDRKLAARLVGRRGFPSSSGPRRGGSDRATNRWIDTDCGARPWKERANQITGDGGIYLTGPVSCGNLRPRIKRIAGREPRLFELWILWNCAASKTSFPPLLPGSERRRPFLLSFIFFSIG